MVKKKKHKPQKETRKRKQLKNSNKGKILLILFLIAVIVYSCLVLKQEEAKTTVSSFKISNTEKLHIPRFTTTRPEYVVTHTGYTVSYNKDHKNPNWTGYELTRWKVIGTEKRSGRFVPDPHIPSFVTRTTDYTNSGYDRGHMVPAADMKWQKKAMEETFYLSNICPQHPHLNQRGWKKLEDKVRKWAIADSAIIVVCGPIINKGCKTIGKNKISVPDAFFKVILSPYVHPPQAIGFVFKNESCTAPLRNYAISVDSVEVLTGLDFFSCLPDEVESFVESVVDTLYWGI